jgi:4-amino-4-deoxy-L-arabinose transferase-like glycosyltransferase
MMLNTDTTKQSSSIFGENSLWLKICLIVMFLLAALIRRDEIRAPGYAITREYNSAIFARAFYVEHNDDIDEWRRNIAITARDQLPLLEPPLTEYLVSWVYRILGREEIWFARYLTGLFWLIGGIFLYRITRILISADEAIVSVAYYLFVPMGIKVSRSFQPDPLMMMMFLISLYFIVKYFERTSWHRLILASVITGITLLIRPLVLFALFGAFVSLSANRQSILDSNEY